MLSNRALLRKSSASCSNQICRMITSRCTRNQILHVGISQNSRTFQPFTYYRLNRQNVNSSALSQEPAPTHQRHESCSPTHCKPCLASPKPCKILMPQACIPPHLLNSLFQSLLGRAWAAALAAKCKRPGPKLKSLKL